MGSLARPTAPVPCAIYTLYRDFFKPRNQIQEVMNGIRGLSSPGSLVPSFKPKFLSDYPSIYLFSKTNNSRFDISNSISVELTTTFKEGAQFVLRNRDLPYLKDGIRISEQKVNNLIRNGNYKRDAGFTTAISRCGIFFLKRTDLTGKKNQLHYLKC